MTNAPALAVPLNLRNYHLEILTKGERWSGDQTPENGRLIAGHLAFLKQLIAEGKLLFAGPLRDDGFIRGIAVLTTESLDEARAICSRDPAVQAGYFAVEVHPASFPSLDGVRVEYAP